MRATFTGVVTGSVLLINTVIGVPIMVLIGLIKLLIPIPAVHRWCTSAVNGVAWLWTELARGLFARVGHIEWDIRGKLPNEPDRSCLLVANHQSWVDIPVIIQNFNNRVPFYKFFIKRQLIWVPLLGLAFWALEFPMMRRYTREQLEKNPELKGRDLEATKKACERFRHMPVTFINFPEGTRYRNHKHRAQNSPYDHLLRPRAGGMAFVMESMGELIDTIYNITIVYPNGTPRFIDLLTGRVGRVVVHIERIEVLPTWQQGGYQTDETFRNDFQTWVSDLWAAKDRQIDETLQEFQTRANTDRTQS